MQVLDWIDSIEGYLDKLCESRQMKKLDPPIFLIRLSYVALHSFSVPKERIRLLGISTVLLKMGLDIHVQDRHGPMDVLMGDALSIQFYHLLSKGREIEVIRHLAKTISTINEQNLEHYVWSRRGHLFDVKALRRIEYISSSLLLSLAEFLKRSSFQRDLDLWECIIPRAVLLHEIASFKELLTREGETFIGCRLNELLNAISHIKCEQNRHEIYQLLMEYHIISAKEGAYVASPFD